jgi:hypothetical protein
MGGISSNINITYSIDKAPISYLIPSSSFISTIYADQIFKNNTD